MAVTEAKEGEEVMIEEAEEDLVGEATGGLITQLNFSSRCQTLIKETCSSSIHNLERIK
jgi:hypothetical protein